MILVDTSVWVQHLRKGSDRLRSLLDEERVFCHPFVIGEVACGTLRNRQEVLSGVGAVSLVRTVGCGKHPLQLLGGNEPSKDRDLPEQPVGLEEEDAFLWGEGARGAEFTNQKVQVRSSPLFEADRQSG